MNRVFADGALRAGVLLLSLVVPATAGAALANSENPLTGASQHPNLVVADCAAARDPARCLALQQAHAACRGKRGSAKRQCLKEKLPLPDCSRAPDAQRCLAQQQVQTACQRQSGKALRACLKNSPVRQRKQQTLRPSPASAG